MFNAQGKEDKNNEYGEWKEYDRVNYDRIVGKYTLGQLKSFGIAIWRRSIISKERALYICRTCATEKVQFRYKQTILDTELNYSFGIMINTNKNNDPTGGSNIITKNPWTGQKVGD